MGQRVIHEQDGTEQQETKTRAKRESETQSAAQGGDQCIARNQKGIEAAHRCARQTESHDQQHSDGGSERISQRKKSSARIGSELLAQKVWQPRGQCRKRLVDPGS